MAVVSVNEIEQDGEGRDDAEGNLSFVRTFRVVVDSATDDQPTVLAASGLPLHLEAYPTTTIPQTYATSRRASREDRLAWTVSVEYGALGEDITGAGASVTPIDLATKVEWSFINVTVPAVKDINGNAILNTAKEPFDPPAEMERAMLVVRFTRNMASFSVATAYEYINSVNNATFYGAGAKELRIVDIHPEELKDPNTGITYYRVTVEMIHNRDTWVLKPLSQGQYKIVDPEGDCELQLLEDKNGQPLTAPGLLDEDGDVIGPCDTPYFMEYDVYPAKDFSALGIV